MGNTVLDKPNTSDGALYLGPLHVGCGSKPLVALVEHKNSASLPKPDICAHNSVQDALVSDEISVG